MTASRPPSLPRGVLLAVVVLLIVPMLALLIVPIYAKDTPTLWGFPFFYWWQFLWVFIAAACTWAAYVLIDRARRRGHQPARRSADADRVEPDAR